MLFFFFTVVPGTPSVLSVLALYANASKLTNVNISWTQQVRTLVADVRIKIQSFLIGFTHKGKEKIQQHQQNCHGCNVKLRVGKI